MKIILIRHGEGYHNLKYNNTGKSDNYDILYPSLTENGIKQARELNKILNKEKIDKILVSPLKRTLQTYHYVFLGRNISTISSDCIREYVQNRCDYRENINKYIIQYKNIDFSYISEKQDVYKLFAGIENYIDIKKRCDTFYQWLQTNKNNNVKCIAVVTHGAFLKQFLEIYSNNLHISDISFFKNCEYRIGHLN